MAKAKYTSIGGQALIEGILMKSPEKTALCVRLPDGSIDTSYMNEKKLAQKYKFFGLPIIRGVVSFVEAMLQGYKALMISADKSGFTDFEEEEKKDEKKESAVLNLVMAVGGVLGVVLAVVLFMYLPRLLVDGIEWVFSTKIDSKL